MFTKRSAPGETMTSPSDLQSLREKRWEHARSFHCSNGQVKLPDLTSHFSLKDIMSITQEHTSQTGSPSHQSISLLDTLPAFMALSAAHNDMQETTITNMWMNLAAGYMVQAVAEQFLNHGWQSSQMLQSAFAWGFDANCLADEGSDEWQINAMFFGEEGILNGWDKIRNEHMQAVGYGKPDA